MKIKVLTLGLMLFSIVLLKAQNDTLFVIKSNNIYAKFNVNNQIDSLLFYDGSKVSQDSLYVMKNGGISVKFDINKEIDSLVFYNPKQGVVDDPYAVNLKTLYPNANLRFEENFNTWTPVSGNPWEASNLGAQSTWLASGGELKIRGNDQSMIGNIKLADANKEGTIIYELGSISGNQTSGEWNIRPRFFVSGGANGFMEINQPMDNYATVRASFPGTNFPNTQSKMAPTRDLAQKLRITRFKDGTLSVFSWNDYTKQWFTVVDRDMFDAGTVYVQLFITPGTFSNTREVTIDRVTAWGEEIFDGIPEPNLTGKNPANIFNPKLSYKTHLFYYNWYGNPQLDFGWVHWNQSVGISGLPNSIGADFYPVHGAYSSSDMTVIDKHMQMIAQARVGVIAVSWWGQGSRSDQLMDKILDAAEPYGIKVAWLVEPYVGRTGQTTADDIKYINQKYGYHPAFFYAADKGNKPVFYVWHTTLVADWSALDQVNQSNIVLAQHTNLSPSMTAHWSGLYNYSVPYQFYDDAGLQKLFTDMSNGCNSKGLIWSNSIIPGYSDIRATPNDAFHDRLNGQTYTKYWNMAVNSGTSWISITSFNEWHEGTGIEPVKSNPPSGLGYYSFNGAYGKTGVASENAYIDKTAELILSWDTSVQP